MLPPPIFLFVCRIDRSLFCDSLALIPAPNCNKLISTIDRYLTTVYFYFFFVCGRAAEYCQLTTTSNKIEAAEGQCH